MHTPYQKMLMTFQATQGYENVSSTNSFSHAIYIAKRPFVDTTLFSNNKFFYKINEGKTRQKEKKCNSAKDMVSILREPY